MEKKLCIEGMMCMRCAARVQKALEELDGVTGAVVSHEAGTAVVTLAKDLPDSALRQAVEDKGYTVTGIA